MASHVGLLPGSTNPAELGSRELDIPNEKVTYSNLREEVRGEASVEAALYKAVDVYKGYVSREDY